MRRAGSSCHASATTGAAVPTNSTAAQKPLAGHPPRHGPASGGPPSLPAQHLQQQLLERIKLEGPQGAAVGQFCGGPEAQGIRLPPVAGPVRRQGGPGCSVPGFLQPATGCGGCPAASTAPGTSAGVERPGDQQVTPGRFRVAGRVAARRSAPISRPRCCCVKVTRIWTEMVMAKPARGSDEGTASCIRLSRPPSARA